MLGSGVAPGKWERLEAESTMRHGGAEEVHHSDTTMAPRAAHPDANTEGSVALCATSRTALTGVGPEGRPKRKSSNAECGESQSAGLIGRLG